MSDNRSSKAIPIAAIASELPPREKKSIMPEIFASRVHGRTKTPLGDIFGITNFGVNQTRLEPKAISALRHSHSLQDEFIYILQGYPTLYTDQTATQLKPGMCAGFKSGSGNGHHLINETNEDVIYLEVGDRTLGDEATYPDDDLKASYLNGAWKFTKKNGDSY